MSEHGGVPDPPEAVGVHFGAHLEQLSAYATQLAGDGVLRGLIGPREVPRLWDRHLLNCAVLVEALPEGSRIADVGSGAGLPGLVLAILRPDTEVTLIEPLLRRVGFLEECIASLGLGHVRVRRARAHECLELFGCFDVVTARAVASLDRLVDWTMPLLRPGGRLLALKGARASEEVELAGPRLGGADVSAVTVRRYGQGIVDVPTTVVEVTAARVRRSTNNVSRETRS